MTKDVMIPTMAELSSLDTQKLDQLTVLLNNDPPKEWIKVNKYAGNSNYLPIDKIEYLLKVLFKRYRIEVTGQGTSFNGVYVTVRVHYVHPLTGEWDFHDGIGSEAIQTKKDTSPSDLINITQGAISIAFPKAKTSAIKDACHHFGRVFGSDLNRSSEDDLYKMPEVINYDELVELWELKKDHLDAKLYKNGERIINEKEVASYKKLHKYLSEL